jgi:hypothetical protein
MRGTKRSKLIVVLLVLPLLWSKDVIGHDLLGLVAETESVDPATRGKIEHIMQTLARLSTQAKMNMEGRIEAVVQTSLRWPNSPVSVCFFDGSQSARDHVADIADRWTPGTSLKFDFGLQGIGASATQADRAISGSASRAPATGRMLAS